jgi:methylmalonyl-CoA mutase
MSNLAFDFPETTLDKWKSQILKELKDDSSKMNFTDEVEEISIAITNPAEHEFSSALNNPTNDWKISAFIEVLDEKTANQLALNCLNQGNNELIFKFNQTIINWEVLFASIELPYIHTRLQLASKEQLDSFLSSKYAVDLTFFSFEFDPLTAVFSTIDEQVKALKENRVIAVNGFDLQQIGASSWQEIGIVLSNAHELLQRGFTPNQLSLKVGIGSNYFIEIAKLRALRYLWNQITTAYEIKNSIEIVSHIGWCNKSLKDQHTNLLRQTTEAMAAAAGDSDSIVVHPYDELSTDGSSDFANRMATNISNLLKEESYFDKVQDPLKGSTIVENLTASIIEKSWSYFLELESFKSLNSKDKIEKIKADVSSKAVQRLAQFEAGKIPLIGINLFNQENPKAQTWKTTNRYLDLSYLIYEQHKS